MFNKVLKINLSRVVASVGGIHKPCRNLTSKSNISQLNTLNPWYITGLVDGEGSWVISITKNSKRSLGFHITLSFEIGLHNKDLNILKGLLSYFGVGGIYKHSGDMLRYKVSSVKDLLKVIIPHFDKYPLVTKKRADFELFKSALSIINKGPLSLADLQSVVDIKASLNNGLSPELQSLFPKTVPVKRPVYLLTDTYNPFWVVGFTEAESSFFIGFYKSKSCRLGTAVRLRFVLTQHSRDEKMLQGFIKFFGCGTYTLRKNNLAGDFIVFKLEEINSKIIPFFLQYPLLGSKALSFQYFYQGAEIMNNKGHLSLEGLSELQSIKSRMNKF